MLKFILILSLIAYVLYKSSGYISRFLLRLLGKRMQKMAERQYQEQQGFRETQKDGVTIRYSTQKKSKKASTPSVDDSDYIEYEEIKD